MPKQPFFRFATLFVYIAFMACKKDSITTSSPETTSDFTASSVAFTNNGTYPKKYTCDSLGISPPISWANAPVGTASYAITMHTIAIDGARHEYIILYNIPPTILSIAEGITGVGLWGINTVNGKTSYTPPCSQGSGSKLYVITVYALSAAPVLTVPQTQVTMSVLLEGMAGKTLATSTINITYTR